MTDVEVKEIRNRELLALTGLTYRRLEFASRQLGLKPPGRGAVWTPDEVRFFIDHRWVKTVRQTIDYPMQLMLDVYEFPRADGTRDTDALPHVLRVERVRTFPPV